MAPQVPPLHGSFRGDTDIGLDVDVHTDLDSDNMAVSWNGGSLKR